jgi:hypothetical protein
VHVVTGRDQRSDQWQPFRHAPAYHHGYFDGIDAVSWFRAGRAVGYQELASSPIGDVAGYQPRSAFVVPPTLTKTWFHTGAYLAGAHLAPSRNEYYREPIRASQEVS